MVTQRWAQVAETVLSVPSMLHCIFVPGLGEVLEKKHQPEVITLRNNLEKDCHINKSGVGGFTLSQCS